MPRRPTHTESELVEAAMMQFWRFGYAATSMDQLVEGTGVSRHGIYSSFGGKRALFLACLESYQDLVVTPAFAAVEAEDAALSAIADYFEFQIARAEVAGLPGPGCLVANTMTELGPHDAGALARIEQHHRRLHRGFRKALTAADGNQPPLASDKLDDLASLLVNAAQGLWSLSRSVDDAAPLRRIVETLLDLIRLRLAP
ncbi:MAG: helix-turn-helix domain-containing protein [Alphaproteobacteria bacterium]